MLEYIQSPEFQQLLAEQPLFLFLLIIVGCVTLIGSLACFPRWFTVTNEHHHHHYHPAPGLSQGGHPLHALPPGYYYLDPFGRIQAVGVRQSSEESESDASEREYLDRWLDKASKISSPNGVPPVYRTARSRKNRSKMSSAKRFRILERDGFRCQICGAKATDDNDVTLHIDHRKPLAAGGTNDDENLWTLCDTCNRGKSDLIVPELLPQSNENGENGGSPEN